MKFAHLLVAAHVAERPEPGPFVEAPLGLCHESTDRTASSRREDGDGARGFCVPARAALDERQRSGPKR
jgi:hypothetical protein